MSKDLDLFAKLRRSLLDDNLSLDAALRALTPRAERTTLKRIALVREFDRDLYDNVLTKGVDPTTDGVLSFDALVKNRDVEQVRGGGVASGLDDSTPGKVVYRLAPDRRDEWLEEWFKDDRETPSDQEQVSAASVSQTLARELHRYYESRGPAHELDALLQQFSYDVPEASRQFERMFQAAEDDFDLPRCATLVQLVERRARLYGFDVARLAARYRTYLRQREASAQDYHRTVTYLERESLHRDCESWLSLDGNRWILQVYASGGYGKTMFVRWLTSRRCAARRIPFARVDCDDLDVQLALDHPGLLVLELADQLARQIPGNVFHELLQRFDAHRGALRRSVATRVRDVPAARAPRPPENLAAAIVPDVITALLEANLDVPVVVCCDTLEQITLYHPQRLAEFVRLMADVHRQYPGLRLALAGRYDLRQRVDAFEAEFLQVATHHELAPFSPTEAMTYLTDRRRLNPSLPLAAIVDVCAVDARINPFKLAICADLARSRPDLQESDVREFRDAEIAWVIQRVVERIEDPQVRWLLRFGVVPNQLTREFVREVIAGPLAAAMSAADSQASEGVVGAKNWFPRQLLPAGQAPDVDLLWRKLADHAAPYAWVRPVGGDVNRLEFHEDVLTPLRRLLKRDLPVEFALLHRASAEYLERNVPYDETNREPWRRAMLEVLYHRSQLAGDEFAATWRRLQSDVVSRGDHVSARELARALLRLSADAPLDDETLAEADFAEAVACVALAESSSQHSGEEWQAARRALDRSVVRNLGRSPGKAATASWRLLKAKLYHHERHFDEARRLLEETPADQLATPEQLDRAVLVARLLAARQRDRAAATAYVAAAALAEQHGRRAVQCGLLRTLAAIQARRWRLDLSVPALEQAIRIAVELNDRELLASCQADLGEHLISCGRPTAALEFVVNSNRRDDVEEPSRSTLRRARLRKRLVEIDARRALNELEGARTTCEQALQDVERCRRESEEQGESEDYASLELAFRESLAAIEASFYEFESATRILIDVEEGHARSSWRERALQATLRRLSLQLEVMGNARDTARLLGGLRQAAGQEENPSTRLAADLLQVELSHVSGRTDEARLRIAEIVADTVRRARTTPRTSRIAVSLAGLARGGRETRELSLRMLVSALRGVHPSAARVTLIERLDRCPSLGDLPAELVARFRALWPQVTLDSPNAASTEVTAPDTGLAARRLAETSRVTGDVDEARARLEYSRRQLRPEQKTWETLKLLRAYARAGLLPPDAPFLDDSLEASVAHAAQTHPLFAGVLLWERLQWASISSDDLGRASDWTRVAELCQAREHVRHVWHARAAAASAEAAWRAGDGIAAGEAWARSIEACLSLGNVHEALELLETAIRRCRKSVDGRLVAWAEPLAARLVEVAEELARRTDDSTAGRVLFDSITLRTGVLSQLHRLEEAGRLLQQAQARRSELFSDEAIAAWAAEFGANQSSGNSFPVMEIATNALRSAGAWVLSHLFSPAKETSSQSEVPKPSPADSPTRSVLRAAILPAWTAPEYVDVRTTRDAEPPTQRRIAIADDHFLQRLLTATTGEFFSQEAVEGLAKNWLQFSAELGALLFADQEAAIRQMFEREPDACDIQLQIDYLELAGLPWEILTLPRRPEERAAHSRPSHLNPLLATLPAVRHLHRVSPHFGASQRRVREEPGVALVVAPSLETSLHDERGSFGFETSARHVYHRQRVAAVALEDPSIDDLARALHTHRPAVVHFATSIHSTPDLSAPFLRLTEGRRDVAAPNGGPGRALTPDLLNELLASIPRTPLIILDVPTPPGPTEGVRQLLLRNLFAWQLTQSSLPVSILATGCDDPRQPVGLATAVIKGLAHGASLGAIVQAIRQRADTQPDGNVASLGRFASALFADDPDAVIPVRPASDR